MSYTCISCKVIFSESEFQREHYRSDWHRYNLKRKVAELPPVTKEEFDERAASYKVTVEEKVQSECQLCHKYFSTQNALVNHMKSKKHLEMLASGKSVSEKPRQQPAKPNDKSGALKPVEEVETVDDEECDDDDSDGWESVDEDDFTFDTSACLFCLQQSNDVEGNIAHMTTSHSFFIPDVEYLADLERLIGYLGDKIVCDHVCLWCNDKGKAFKSAKATQQHMLDKGHCKMLYEGDALAEYGNFYDYSSSYDDASKENTNEDVTIDLLEGSGYELVLPSGATIGHRSLALYYHQNLKPLKPGNEKKIKKIIQQYQALGWTGTTGEAAVRKARDLKYMRKVQSKFALKMGIKTNKFQPHFRRQVMF